MRRVEEELGRTYGGGGMEGSTYGVAGRTVVTVLPTPSSVLPLSFVEAFEQVS